MQDINITTLIDRDLHILSESKNYLSFQFSKIEKYLGNRILEIGAGIGNHTKKIIKKSPELIIALEKEYSFCQILKDTFGDTIITLQNDLNNLQEYYTYLSEKEIDTILAINVLEHIEKDIECLKLLSNILVSKGRIILIVPAFHFLYSKLDKKYGHYRRYTISDFQKYSKLLNLSLIKCSYFNFPSFFLWFIFAKIGGNSNINENRMKIFDNFFPLIGLIENAIPVFPFGLSLLGVFEKDTF